MQKRVSESSVSQSSRRTVNLKREPPTPNGNPSVRHYQVKKCRRSLTTHYLMDPKDLKAEERKGEMMEEEIQTLKDLDQDRLHCFQVCAFVLTFSTGFFFKC
jgi:hypothetical protein